jgi:hypothetical protein
MSLLESHVKLNGPSDHDCNEKSEVQLSYSILMAYYLKFCALLTRL